MGAKKITELATITEVANDDILVGVDVSDTSGSAQGTNKKFTKSALLDGSGIQQLDDAATIEWDGLGGRVAVVTLGGNRTVGNPDNVIAGQRYVLIVKQDATGNRTLNWGSNFKFTGGTAPTLTTSGNSVDVLEFIAESSSVLHLVKFSNNLQ